MNFFKKFFNSNKTKNEPEFIISDVKLVINDVHGNIVSEEEKKMLKGFRKQEEERKREREER